MSSMSRRLTDSVNSIRRSTARLDARAHGGKTGAPVLAAIPRRRALGRVRKLFLELLDRACLRTASMLLHLARRSSIRSSVILVGR